MRPSPTVTIAIPAFDRPALLREALEALVAQEESGLSWEVVVCDDLGLPETRTVVESFDPARFFYRRSQGRPGPVANWNRCLEAGSGEWITVLHEDDALLPHFLRLVAPLLTGERVAVCTRTVQGDAPPACAPRGSDRPAKAPALLRYEPAFFIKSAMTPFPGVVMRRSVALRLGGFDEAWGPLADYEFWYRLALAGPVDMVRAVGAFYRVSPGQWTETAWIRMLRLTHLMRLRIAREQFAAWPRLGRWMARFFTARSARAYAGRFPERPAGLARALSLRRIPFGGLPSGWVWALLRLR